MACWEAFAHQQFDGCLGFGVHDAILVMVPPVPCKLFHISLPIFLNGAPGWLGSYPSKNYFDKEHDPSYSVDDGGDLGSLPDGTDADGDEDNDEFWDTLGPADIPFLTRTTDAGLIVPHFSIPMNNAILPLTWLFGGSISIFGSSKVQLMSHNMLFSLIFGDNTGDIAACNLGPLPLSLNVSCNDPIPLPFDLAFTFNTVKVGVSLTDVWNALKDFALEVLFAVIGNAVGDMIGGGGATKSLKKNLNPVEAFDGWGSAGKMAFREGQEAAAEEATEKLAKEAGGEATEGAVDGVGKAGRSAKDAEKAYDDAAKEFDEADKALDKSRAAADAPNATEKAKLDYEVEKADFQRKFDDVKAKQSDFELKKAEHELKQKQLDDLLAKNKAAREAAEKKAGEMPTRTWREFGGALVGKMLYAGKGSAINTGKVVRDKMHPTSDQASAAPESAESVSGVEHPTVELRSGDLHQVSGEWMTSRSPIGVRAVFSKPVQGFSLDHVRAIGCVASGLAAVDDVTYEFAVTPQVESRQHFTIDVDAAQVEHRDEFGLGYPNKAAQQLRVLFTSDRPAVCLTSPESGRTNRQSIPMTAHFNVPVTGFGASGLLVQNARVEDFRAQSEREYGFDLVPGGEGEVGVKVPDGRAKGANGRPNTASATFSIVCDTTAPLVTLDSSLFGTTAAERIPVDVRFSKPVRSFGEGQVQVGNGRIAGFEPVTEGRVYRLEVEPSQNGSVTVTVAAGAVQDEAGNANTGEAEYAIYYDGTDPARTLESDHPDLSEPERGQIQKGLEIMAELSG